MTPQTPGYKTTEFWITVLAVVVGLLAVGGIFEDGSRWSQVFGFIQTSLVTAGYTIARGVTKGGAAKAAGAVEVARLASGSYVPITVDKDALRHIVPQPPPRTGP